MEEEKNIPFDDVLTTIFNQDIASLPHLYRLSDMSESDYAKFLLYWNSASDEKRKVILRHLADISEQNFTVDFSPIFKQSFHDPYPPVRIAALDGLWDSTDTKLVDPILKLLNEDPDREVQVAAARSIAHFLLLSEWDQIRGVDSNRVFDELRKTYESPESVLPLKCAVLEAMGPIPVPELPNIIEDAYEGYIPELQLSAVFAMGTSADPRWLPILLDEMESPKEEMRAEAARAAGLIGSSQAISQLTELAIDDDQDVAAVAIVSIAQIGGDQADSFLSELLADPLAEHLHQIIEEALEEASWLGGELPMFPWSEDEPNGAH